MWNSENVWTIAQDALFHRHVTSHMDAKVSLRPTLLSQACSFSLFYGFGHLHKLDASSIVGSSWKFALEEAVLDKSVYDADGGFCL